SAPSARVRVPRPRAALLSKLPGGWGNNINSPAKSCRFYHYWAGGGKFATLFAAHALARGVDFVADHAIFLPAGAAL
ncbi:MAG: hypothetical protein OXC81_02975, partial [Betaproteobacteria bacterium]|nr:hypothetical protein [Betaproteobacteria bacterium]